MQRTTIRDFAPTEPPPSPVSWGAILERAWILFSLYVLSIGPMYWTWYRQRHMQGGGFFAFFYEPLVRLADLIPPLGEWLNNYVRWWILRQ